MKEQEAAAATEVARDEVDGNGEDGGEGGKPVPVSPPSEFDAEGMVRYFRVRDELASVAVS